MNLKQMSAQVESRNPKRGARHDRSYVRAKSAIGHNAIEKNKTILLNLSYCILWYGAVKMQGTMK